MATAVYGRKRGMTQAFLDDGTLVGVTVIEVDPNVITAVRTADEDGYEAVQVGFGAVNSGRVNKAKAGTFAKADTPPRKHLRELRGVTGEVGETIGAGDRFGLIRFGSRLDTYLPEGSNLLVSLGQRAIAGETVLAELP